jgi:hypothetical protein
MRLLGSAPKTDPASFYRNSDPAFRGRLAFAGNYLGFRVIDIADPEAPVVLADVDCPGQQHDVSVWRNLLFLSIDRPLTAPECGSPQTPVVDGVITPGFEGIRIFDVADPRSPRYVGAVATDCGSHTHTLVPDPDDTSRVLLYVASYPASALGPTPFGTQCSRTDPGHSKISIVEVPLAAPQQSRVIAQPTFELNDFTAPGFRGCHDITVFLQPRIAAAACLSEGQMWDLSDLERPRTTARVHNPNVQIWHSAAFTWDNQIVVFGDEAGGGAGAFCKATDPSTVGAAWFYRVADLDTLSATAQERSLGHFKIPRPQGDRGQLHDPQLQRDPGPRPLPAGLCQLLGRHLGGRLHRPRQRQRDRALRPARRQHLVVVLVQQLHLHQRLRSRRGRRAAVGPRAGRGPQVSVPQPPDPGVAAGLKRQQPRVAAASRSAAAILGLKPRSGNRLAPCSAAGSSRPVPARP